MTQVQKDNAKIQKCAAFRKTIKWGKIYSRTKNESDFERAMRHFRKAMAYAVRTA